MLSSKSSRTKNSLRNSSFAVGSQAIAIVLSFITRTVFIKSLGVSFLGINGLFTNIVSVLSFTELGFSTAVIYALYAPLATNDIDKVSRLMNYYSKAYRTIGVIVFVLGLCLLPFLNSFIKQDEHLLSNLPPLWLIYMLFLLNTSLSYFFNYKRSIILASQNGHIDSVNQLTFNVIKNALQIGVLLFFHSFLLFLIIQLSTTLLSNYFISRKADKIFGYLKENKEKTIDSSTKAELKRNVFAMSFNKLGSIAITDVDNILISKFIGLAAIGYYSNYLLLTNTVKVFFIQIMSPITASVGNFVVEKSKQEAYIFFKKLFFLNAYIAIVITICLGTLANPFIYLIWGKEYVFPIHLTIAIFFNFYLDRMRQSSQIFIDAKGLFWQIKWKSVIEAIINLSLVSYFLIGLKWGIMGVVVGTILSNLATNIWWEPYVVFKHGLEKPVYKYYLQLFLYTSILIVSYFLSSYFQDFFSEGFGGFLGKALVAVVVPNLIVILVFFRTDEFKYFLKLLPKGR